jgi:predicted negative regulator of RcsB-dependent stress response
MRLAPEFAENVLHAVTGRDDQPLLALVRGDALRLLGREAEALEAFDRARGRASVSSGASQPPSGPGLFDADPALADDEGV